MTTNLILHISQHFWGRHQRSSWHEGKELQCSSIQWVGDHLGTHLCKNLLTPIAGELHAVVAIPAEFSLEGSLSNISGEDKQLFLKFVRRMLTWEPKDRSTAKSCSMIHGLRCNFSGDRSKQAASRSIFHVTQPHSTKNYLCIKCTSQSLNSTIPTNALPPLSEAGRRDSNMKSY